MSKGTNYKFSQMFGYKGPNQKVNEQDIISAVKFDTTGQFLALGDRAGRIIIFQSNHNPKRKQESLDYYSQFQSHNKQFDCLRSQQVQQTITDISWLRSQSKYQKLITTNGKSIKLWKVSQKNFKKVSKSSGSDLKMPNLQTIDTSFIANIQQSFPSKHHTDIHTISKSFNQQYLLSFDQVQGYLWNIQRPDKPYILVDYLKNLQVEDVKQNVTCGGFHPTNDSIMAYGTNKKTLKIHDMRLSANQNQTGMKLMFQQKTAKNFFTQLIQNYSSVEFLKNGKYLAARDYLTVKVWDLANTKKPILNIGLQQTLKTKLCQVFQNDCIFDKFKLSSSNDGNTLVTGNYNNCFHLIDTLDGTNTQYELNYKKSTVNRNILADKPPALPKMDYIRKVNVCDFNKKKNSLAVASLNCFFIYSM